jgi:hypothetical protein
MKQSNLATLRNIPRFVGLRAVKRGFIGTDEQTPEAVPQRALEKYEAHY